MQEVGQGLKDYDMQANCQDIIGKRKVLYREIKGNEIKEVRRCML